MRRIVGRQVHLLSYTYYYHSFFEILRRFCEALEKDEEFPVRLEEQLQVISAIDDVYQKKRVS
jgi:hypothetical protein